MVQFVVDMVIYIRLSLLTRLTVGVRVRGWSIRSLFKAMHMITNFWAKFQ
eukprot:jgi/Botrbrau1/14820/Bobra.168_3s0002.1